MRLFAPLAKLVDAPDLGSGIERCESSSLLGGTILKYSWHKSKREKKPSICRCKSFSGESPLLGLHSRVLLYGRCYSQAPIRYRVWTHTLFGSQRPATDPDITASALERKPRTPKLAFSVLDYNIWFDSISVSISHCHCEETGSIPVRTANFLGVV